MSSSARQTVSSAGGGAGLAARLSPLRLDPCASFAARVARGTAVVTRRTSGFTLLGRTTVSARVRVRGSGAQLVGRLWDLDPRTGRQRLIDRGVARLRSAGTVSFRLNGNGWRVRAGHRVRVELLGRDAPTYRPSNGTFRVEVSRLRVALPPRASGGRGDRRLPVRRAWCAVVDTQSAFDATPRVPVTARATGARPARGRPPR